MPYDRNTDRLPSKLGRIESAKLVTLYLFRETEGREGEDLRGGRQHPLGDAPSEPLAG